MQLQGVIENVSTKNGMGKNGPWTMYSMQVSGEWYGCGFKALQARQGDYVSFDFEQSGNFKNAKNVKVVAPPAGGQQPAAAPQAQAQGVSVVNKRDVSIQYQSSRKDAIQVLDLLIKHDAVSLPAKKADKFDAALALLDELTARFYLRLEDVIDEGGVSVEDLVPSTEAG